jgi:hypothetical protein
MPPPIAANGLSNSAKHAAKHAGNREGADASGPATGRLATHPPPTLKPKQQANTERESKSVKLALGSPSYLRRLTRGNLKGSRT